MDFKNYVRLVLEKENGKDEDKKKKTCKKCGAESDELEDGVCPGCADEDDDDDEDFEPSVKNGTTGREPSVCCGKKRPSVEDDEDEDEDDDDDEDEGCKTKKGNSLKESILATSRSLCESTAHSEKAELISEGIRSGSASKYMFKLAKKAEKEAAKAAKKGDQEAVKAAKNVAKKLREGGNKIQSAETSYKEGNPAAKIEYKKLCGEYSKYLKSASRVAGGITKGLLITIAAGVGVLGAMAGMSYAEGGKREFLGDVEDIYDGIVKGKFKSVKKGFKSIASNDKDFIDGILDKITGKETSKSLFSSAGKDAKSAAEKFGKGVKKAGKELGDKISGKASKAGKAISDALVSGQENQEKMGKWYVEKNMPDVANRYKEAAERKFGKKFD